MSVSSVRLRTVARLLGLVLGGGVIFYTACWPFYVARVLTALGKGTGTLVHARESRAHFIPFPGLTLEDVTFGRPGAPRLARAAKLELRGAWLGVLSLRRELDLLQIQGLQILLPAEVPAPVHFDPQAGHGTVVRDLVANDALLQIESADLEKSPLRFQFHELRLRNVGVQQTTDFSLQLTNPNPPGELSISGSMGPVRFGELAQTALKGSFVLNKAHLSHYHNLEGLLDGRGGFQGLLGKLQAKGEAAVSGFQVNRTGHPIALHAQYRATINGLTGDVLLEGVRTDFLGSRLFTKGMIEHRKGYSGKVVALEVSSREARVEDLLYLASKSPQPALQGPIAFHAVMTVPQGSDRFLKRLLLEGSFKVDPGVWTNPRTTQKVNELSTQARGEKRLLSDGTPPAPVDSYLEGSIKVNNGTASLSKAMFRVLGATARGEGSYDLITREIDLRGFVALQAEASEAATGLKSMFLKPFDKMFRGKRGVPGAVLPVFIQGVYPSPRYIVHLK